MKHAHVAIFSTPSPAHLHPTLTILRTLLRRGYEVTYITSGSFASTAEQLGAKVLLCPRIEFPFTQSKNEALPVEEQYSPHIIDLASRTIPLVLPFFERHRPDLILYDSAAYAGLVIGAKLRVPTIRLSPQFAYTETSIECSKISPALRSSLLDLKVQSDEFFQACGVQRRNIIFNTMEPTEYFYVDDFQLGQYARDTWNLYAGRCAAERPCDGVWRSTRVDDRPSVLVSTTTVYREGPGLEYYKTCMHALNTLHWHTVLAIGGDTDPAGLYPLPPNCEIVQHTPLILIMPHVDVIVCAAGMSTTMESMYHGLPMLMLTPGHHELEVYAQNVEDLGLGRHLRKDIATVENITRCATQMFEDRALRQRVRQMQEKVRRSAGGEEVVNWLEQMLKGHAH